MPVPKVYRGNPRRSAPSRRRCIDRSGRPRPCGAGCRFRLDHACTPRSSCSPGRHWNGLGVSAFSSFRLAAFRHRNRLLRRPCRAVAGHRGGD